ncbi:MAG TPA: tyrosine-type recombinase/integrase [Solirubrobacteraceae bacterium]|jgi:integrase|nr:tyrosine-type recombinase/integrase [Solirubrobacteraceae bacterium]
MPLNRGTRHDPRYCGYAKYRGQKKWVGTHTSLDAFKAAKERCQAELREEVDNPSRRRGVPTVLEFAGATIHDNGRITMTWPDGERAQKATGRRSSTVRHMRDGLTPFVREFGDRSLDDFQRDEALTWIRPKSTNVKAAVRQFFNHAVDRDLIERNRFTNLGASKRKRRVDRPDFQIITDEQYERLRRCARESRADDYGLILEGATMTVGETAMRPGEIFGLHRPEVHMDTRMIHVRRQIDLATGEITWPKDDDGRWVPMSPALFAHFETMPHMGKVVHDELGEIVFPSIRGGYIRRSQWSSLWNAIRVAAGMPGVDFYELKHRAIQWMVDPVADGGLGLDPATAAEIIGHDDGGYLISTVYTKLGQRRALARAQRAMTAYQQRQDATTAAEPRRLEIVGAAA